MVPSKHTGWKIKDNHRKIPRRDHVTQLIMLRRQRPRKQEFIRFLHWILRAREVENFRDCEPGYERTYKDGHSRRSIVGEERRDWPGDSELRWICTRVPARGFKQRWWADKAIHRGVQRDGGSLPWHAQTSSSFHGCGMFSVTLLGANCCMSCLWNST